MSTQSAHLKQRLLEIVAEIEALELQGEAADFGLDAQFALMFAISANCATSKGMVAGRLARMLLRAMPDAAVAIADLMRIATL